MAGLAQDPLVLKVAELLEIGQRLDKEHAELTKEVARHRDEREATRLKFQQELVAAQEAEEAALTRRGEAKAEAAALTKARRETLGADSLPASLERLREELQAERDTAEHLLAEKSQEVDGLRLELEQREEQLRSANEASRAEIARRAPLDSDAAANGDVLAELRAHVEELAVVAAELQKGKSSTAQQVSTLKAEAEKTQRTSAEADAARRERESELDSQVKEMQAETQRMNTQLTNAKEHLNELRSQLRTRLWGAYEGRLLRKEALEQGVQTRYSAEDAQLREKVNKLSEELEELKQRNSDRTPWWAVCLRGSAAGSIGGHAASSAGAALLRALGHTPNHPMAQLTPRGMTPRSQTPRGMTPRSQAALSRSASAHPTSSSSNRQRRNSRSLPAPQRSAVG